MRKINDLKNGYEFDYNSYLSGAWKLFGKETATFIAMTILLFLILLALSLIPVLNFFNNFLSVILFAGFYIYARNIKRGSAKAGDFFQGFNYIGNIFVAQLIIFLLIVPLFFIVFASILPIESIWDLIQGNINSYEFESFVQEDMISNLPLFFLSILLVMGVSIYVSLSFMFATALIVDAQMGFWEALETSRKAVGQHFFSFLVFSIICIIIVAIGTVITCGAGLLIIIPYSYLLIFEMYDQIFQPRTEEDPSSEGISAA